MGSVTDAHKGNDLAQTMVEQIMGTMSDAEALRELRSAFPETPLTVRVAVLAMLMRNNAADHIPR